jgi:hypothetical protein
MSVVPWSWQFVLRRPGTAGAPDDATRDRDVYNGEDRWFGVADADIATTLLASELLETVRAYRRGTVALQDAVKQVVAKLTAAAGDDGANGAFNIDPAVTSKAAELADRHDAVYRGPEWQWLQEALVRLALQAGRRTADVSPAARLTLEDFRSQT